MTTPNTDTELTVQQLAARLRRRDAALAHQRGQHVAVTTEHTRRIRELRQRLDDVEPVIRHHETRLTALERVAGITALQWIGAALGALVGWFAAKATFAANPTLHRAHGWYSPVWIYLAVIFGLAGLGMGVFGQFGRHDPA